MFVDKTEVVTTRVDTVVTGSAGGRGGWSQVQGDPIIQSLGVSLISHTSIQGYQSWLHVQGFQQIYSRLKRVRVQQGWWRWRRWEDVWSEFLDRLRVLHHLIVNSINGEDARGEWVHGQVHRDIRSILVSIGEDDWRRLSVGIPHLAVVTRSVNCICVSF